MTKTYRTADEAIADTVAGAKTIQGTMAEALKLAGVETIDVQGNRAWYCTPGARAPGQARDNANELWHVAVSTDKAANDRSIAAFRAAQGL